MSQIEKIASREIPLETSDYEIKPGDTLFAIARTLDIPLNLILHLNRNIDPRRLRAKQLIKVPKIDKKEFEDRLIDFRKIQEEQEKLNILPFDKMIHGYHIRNDINEPYIIEDKKNHTLSVYQKGKLLFTCSTNTGASGNDFLTKTYQKDGKLISNAGNMSTPAGIFTISGVGNYKGAPSFTRANKNGDIASSIHEFPIIDTKSPNNSNGCTRIAASDLRKLANYIKKGTKVFILPEKEGARFFVRNGEVNFTADAVYGGEDEKSRKNMKDYSTYIPSVSKSIQIESPEFKRRQAVVFAPNELEGGVNYNQNQYELYDQETEYGRFVATIETIKGALQKDLGINNDTYNELALLACSVALQESKFGESKRYQIKKTLGDGVQDFFQKGRKYARREWGTSNPVVAGFGGVIGYFSEVDTEANSKGLAQVKIDAIFSGSNEKVKELLTKYGIDRNTIENPDKSAIAIMILLGSMYIHEVPQLREKLKQLGLSEIDALIYMNQGKKKEITLGTATPEKNLYLQKVRSGMKKFSLLQKEKVQKVSN